MELTKQQLQAAMPNARINIVCNPHFRGITIEAVVELINKYAPEFEITTPRRMAHFLAQIAHECAEFRYTEELASGKDYEGRKDLGNTQQGDGTKFKGRGCIQLTGRANYAAYKDYCGYDVVAQPFLLAKPTGAIRSAMWFWQRKGLNTQADMDAFTTITKRINGGTNGYSSRQSYLMKAKQALKVN